MAQKFTTDEVMDAVTEVLLEMNNKFQKKSTLSAKDMVTVGYVAMALQRLENGQATTSTGTINDETAYDDTNPDYIKSSLEEM